MTKRRDSKLGNNLKRTRLRPGDLRKDLLGFSVPVKRGLETGKGRGAEKKESGGATHSNQNRPRNF